MRIVIIIVSTLILFGCGLPKEATMEEMRDDMKSMKINLESMHHDMDVIAKALSGGTLSASEGAVAIQALLKANPSQ